MWPVKEDRMDAIERDADVEVEAEPATSKQREILRRLRVDRYDADDLTKSYAAELITSGLKRLCRLYGTDDGWEAFRRFELDAAGR